MTTPSFTVDAVTTTYKPAFGGYTGYAYEDELSVQKLLGKSPVRPDGNEVLQSTGLSSRVANVDIYATSAERDKLETLLWRRVSHDDGIDAARMAVITKVSSALYHKILAGSAVWKVTVTLREQRDVFFAVDTFTSLLAWYKADALLDTYADGDKINSWPDSSGNGHTLVYDTINQVPTFKRYIVGGAMPVGRLTNAAWYLKTAARIGDSIGTICTVAGALTNGADAPAIARDDGGTRPRLLTYFSQNDNLYVGDTDDAMRATSGVLDRWVDRNFVEGTGNTDHNVGGTGYHVISEAPPAGAAAKPMNGTRTLLFFGNTGFLGDIAEVLFFSTRLTTDQRLYVETYLKTKYAL